MIPPRMTRRQRFRFTALMVGGLVMFVIADRGGPYINRTFWPRTGLDVSHESQRANTSLVICLCGVCIAGLCFLYPIAVLLVRFRSMRVHKQPRSLFTLFVVVTILGVVLAVIARIRRQELAVAALQDLQCEVYYDYQSNYRGIAHLVDTVRFPSGFRPKTGVFLDPRWFASAERVYLHENQVPNALIHLKRLPSLVSVYVAAEYDDDLGTYIPVNPVVIKRLQGELPNVEVQSYQPSVSVIPVVG